VKVAGLHGKRHEIFLTPGKIASGAEDSDGAASSRPWRGPHGRKKVVYVGEINPNFLSNDHHKMQALFRHPCGHQDLSGC
jgi:hypothetical protein